MNGYFFSIPVFILSILFLYESSCNQGAGATADPAAGKGIFPLASGNYWVYRDSMFSEGKLTSVVNDTDKIVSTSDWEGRKIFVFDDGREWFMSGDTIYQLSTQRTGFKFPSPVMMPSEKEASFNYVFGGDVVIHKKVTKLSSCPDSKWKPIACYRFSDDCNAYAIAGYGVGIIREKISPCFSEKGDYTTRTLIDVHLK